MSEIFGSDIGGEEKERQKARPGATQGPSAREADVKPLHHVPHASSSSRQDAHVEPDNASEEANYLRRVQ
jgi:hypothetical protein